MAIEGAVDIFTPWLLVVVLEVSFFLIIGVCTVARWIINTIDKHIEDDNCWKFQIIVMALVIFALLIIGSFEMLDYETKEVARYSIANATFD